MSLFSASAIKPCREKWREIRAGERTEDWIGQSIVVKLFVFLCQDKREINRRYWCWAVGSLVSWLLCHLSLPLSLWIGVWWCVSVCFLLCVCVCVSSSQTDTRRLFWENLNKWVFAFIRTGGAQIRIFLLSLLCMATGLIQPGNVWCKTLTCNSRQSSLSPRDLYCCSDLLCEIQWPNPHSGRAYMFICACVLVCEGACVCVCVCTVEPLSRWQKDTPVLSTVSITHLCK